MRTCWEFHRNRQCCGLKMLIPDQNFSIMDPGSKNSINFNHKIVPALGNVIQDVYQFLPSRIQGSKRQEQFF
jgi:hypothetical protein